MKNIFFALCLFFLGTVSTLSQSTFEDAKYLYAFKELYDLNQKAVNSSTAENNGTGTGGITDLSQPENVKKLAEQVLQKKQRPLGTGIPNSSGSGAIGQISQATNQNRQSQQTIDFSAARVQKIQKEIDWYIAFANSNQEVFDARAKMLPNLQSFPNSFEYLKTTVTVMEENGALGLFANSGSLGSVVSITQAEILRGIADWALDRAQKELMQAFLKEWLSRLENDSVLQEIFPNTLNMLATKSITTFFTDGNTWRATFQQDFDRLPDHLGAIVDVALTQSGEPIPANIKTELVAGLNLTVALFHALGHNSRPEEILQSLSQKAYANSKGTPVDDVATVNRLTMAIGTLISSLQVKNGTTRSFVDANSILAMSGPEMKTFWQLLFLREHKKLSYMFKLGNDTESAAFYKNVRDQHIGKLQSQLSQIAETIQAINTIRNGLATTQKQVLTPESFHDYTTLTFEFLELGLDTLEKLGITRFEENQFSEYKAKYFEVYRQISQIIEGITTKNYGSVVLNTVNFLIWMGNGNLRKMPSEVFKMVDYVDLITNDIEPESLNALKEHLSKVVTSQLSDYPETKKLANQKLNGLMADLQQYGGRIPKDTVVTKVRSLMKLSDEEKRTLLKETAMGILNLSATSEAVHKYGSLMVNIVMAEDSEDVENAIEAAAMETGGYLIKQNSKFSVTVSFFPGVEYGREEVDGEGGQKGNGSFIGATLPIGVELAWGTNCKGIGAVGAFVQLLDLGAVLNYSLNNDNEQLANRNDFGFREVLSPGAYLMAHIKNAPIVLGGGISYAPSLREIGLEENSIEANAFQYGIFLGVDLNVFTLHGSDSKITPQ